MNTPRPLTAQEAAQLTQGRFVFQSIRVPWKPLLNPREAAAALDAFWADGKRHNTRFIRELLESGEIEGPKWTPKGREGRTWGRGDQTVEAEPAAAYLRISRSSLLAFAARNWTMDAKDSADLILDHIRDLPVTLIRYIAEQAAAMAAKHEAALKEGTR